MGARKPHDLFAGGPGFRGRGGQRFSYRVARVTRQMVPVRACEFHPFGLKIDDAEVDDIRRAVRPPFQLDWAFQSSRLRPVRLSGRGWTSGAVDRKVANPATVEINVSDAEAWPVKIDIWRRIGRGGRASADSFALEHRDDRPHLGEQN